ncbi:MAG: cyclase family protein [Chloroflexota bacterium]|nr:cyclase family protein [Chloroflexota bacterium]
MKVTDRGSVVEALVAAQSSCSVVDLSHTLEERMPVWPALSKYYHSLWYSIHLGDAATSYLLTLSEHTGTHVDAPGHFMPPGHPQHRWVDEVPPETWMGRAAIIDCRDAAPQSAVSPQTVLQWEAEHGAVRAGDIVVFNFGWHEKWATRPHDMDFMTNWPGLGVPCAELLVERGVKAVGVDTLSPDVYGTPGDPIHRTLLGKGVVIIENLANLNVLPAVCYLIALPLKIKEGTGSPIRAVALVPSPASP